MDGWMDKTISKTANYLPVSVFHDATGIVRIHPTLCPHQGFPDSSNFTSSLHLRSLNEALFPWRSQGD